MFSSPTGWLHVVIFRFFLVNWRHIPCIFHGGFCVVVGAWLKTKVACARDTFIGKKGDRDGALTIQVVSSPTFHYTQGWWL